MSKKEKLQGNKVAATLFVGVGGIGSKIIREVCDLAVNDDLSKARFVILDTDVNDLSRSKDGIHVTGIQTSSPRTIRDYLLEDDDAREEWFPNNMIINGKTVSEGAGQVRAISRLALNATIKTGRINALYHAIDDLYNRDGDDKKQTVKVVVASTVAGGTGSGIAMIVAMLIRNYIAENYPDSSAIIRGFFLLPSVMDSIKPATSEKLSLQRNGYATLKEINAFMMRPFFEAVPELNRYMDLGVEVPTSAGGTELLQCSPFDFCFLFDRTDDNVANMVSLGQYRSYAAHSIYEQCIGPMSGKASSKEDNIHREFLDEKKLSRNRFGAAGASVIRYPYAVIRDYVAYEWIEKQIIGHSSEDMTEEARQAMVSESWLVYDKDFQKKEKVFNDNPQPGEKAPVCADVYVSDVETGSEQFTNALREDYIEPKNNKHRDVEYFDQESNDKPMPVVEYYIQQLAARAATLYEQNAGDIFYDFGEMRTAAVPQGQFKNRYAAINDYYEYLSATKIQKIARAFVDRAFNGNEVISAASEPYMIESFLSLDGKALHPNAMRYLLYKLAAQLAKETEVEPDANAFVRDVETLLFGAEDPETGKRDLSSFKALGNGVETNLQALCKTCDDVSFGNGDARDRCNEMLGSFADKCEKAYNRFVRYYVCKEAKDYVARLIAEFEKFYGKFEAKVVGLEKRKKSLITAIEFKDGDCEQHLFRDPEDLKLLVKQQKMSAGGIGQLSELFKGIYQAVKENAKRAARRTAFNAEVAEDIFETVIVAQYKELVSEWCDDAIDVDIVRACALEHKIKCLRRAAEDPQNEEHYLRLGEDREAKMAHMRGIIAVGKNLASPCIVSKGFSEPRAVEAMAFNSRMEDGDGMTMPDDLFVRDNAAPSVSKYELRFFRSFYNMTPMQLQKLCPPQADPGTLSDCVDRAAPGMVGAYFTAYQEYMAKIGPDNRLNPVITPHIDKRWNSITVLPELDPQGYQRVLMKRIHKALIYGFVLQLIEKRQASAHDAEKLVYEYVDGRNGTKKFTVSNHTKCDRLFEVLDSLYFDRYAVHSIHNTVDAKRKKEFESSTLFEDTTFARYLPDMDRLMLVDMPERRALAAEKLEGRQVSLFEIPLLYWNSLPKKDSSELEIMVDAIFEILEKEVKTFVDNDDVAPLIATHICQHYNLMLENYQLCPAVYVGHGVVAPKDNQAIKVIRKKALERISDLDVSQNGTFALCDQTKKDALFV